MPRRDIALISKHRLLTYFEAYPILDCRSLPGMFSLVVLTYTRHALFMSVVASLCVFVWKVYQQRRRMRGLVSTDIGACRRESG